MNFIVGLCIGLAIVAAVACCLVILFHPMTEDAPKQARVVAPEDSLWWSELHGVDLP